MRENCKDISGRKEHSGVMGISVAPLEMQARKPSVSTLKARGETRQFIPEAEDIGVFLPPLNKKCRRKTVPLHFYKVYRKRILASCWALWPGISAYSGSRRFCTGFAPIGAVAGLGLLERSGTVFAARRSSRGIHLIG